MGIWENVSHNCFDKCIPINTNRVVNVNFSLIFKSALEFPDKENGAQKTNFARWVAVVVIVMTIVKEI